MARPPRIEFRGAVYLVTARGNRREDIFVDDEDRQGLLAIVTQALSRFDAEAMSYCLMGNHYHFVLYTRQANLSLLPLAARICTRCRDASISATLRPSASPNSSPRL